MLEWVDPEPVRDEGDHVRVPWTRAELVAVKEAIEVTPLFDGRSQARDTVRSALRAPRIEEVALETEIAGRLAGRIVPIDTATATARAKLLRAVRLAAADAGA
jgi:hypothetical protein